MGTCGEIQTYMYHSMMGSQHVADSPSLFSLPPYWQAATPKAPAMADATAMITFSTMSQVKDLFLVSIRIAV